MLLKSNQNSEMCVLFLDEAGLPEERKEAMKIIHYFLDHPKIAFVILSNNTLDAAKTNRAIQVMQSETTVQDLTALAEGCLFPEGKQSGKKSDKRMKSIIKGLCDAFVECNRAEFLVGLPLASSAEFKEALVDTSATKTSTPTTLLDTPKPGRDRQAQEKHLFHMRDFVYLLRYLRRESMGQGSGRGGPTINIQADHLLKGLRRNFNGLTPTCFEKLVALFFEKIRDAGAEKFERPKDCLPHTLQTLREAFADRLQERENPSHSAFRHIMVIDPTSCSAAVDILNTSGLLEDDRMTVYCSVSDFRDDANERERSLRVSEVKTAMQRGDRVVMVNASTIYSSFFGIGDFLNDICIGSLG